MSEMEPPPAPATRRPLAEVIERTFAALYATGLSVQEAFDTCRALLYGELRGGKAHHGLDRVEWIRQHCGRDFHPGRQISVRWRSEPDGILEIDGHDGVGYSQIYLASLLAVMSAVLVFVGSFWPFLVSLAQ